MRCCVIVVVGIHRCGEEVWEKIKGRIPCGDVQLRVTARRFTWGVQYPGPDDQFDTADDVYLNEELHVPVHKVVHITCTSKDVIHSFFLPNLRLKQDAMPGRRIALWFQATKPGVYPLPCAELCGFGHTGMMGRLVVHTPEEHAAWVKKLWQVPSAPPEQHEEPK